MTVQGQWEDLSEDGGGWDLTSHPAEARSSDEDCERRWASVQPVGDKFQWQVGCVYFYPVTTDEGICGSLEEAQVKAEEVFVDKYIVNFEASWKLVISA